MKETLGQYLKRKRESHLISIQDISHATGMGVHLIEAMEEDDFHVIQQPEMVAKYVRKYASHLHLDTKDVLKRYHDQRDLSYRKKHLPPPLSVFSERTISFRQAKGEKSHFKKRSFRIIVLSAAFLLVIAASYLYYNVMFSKTEAPDNRKKIASEEIRKDVSRTKSDWRLSVDSEKMRQTPDHSSVAPVRNAIPQERDKRKKELNSRIQNTQQLAEDSKIVANRDSKLYHLPGMKYYHKVKSHHRITFNSEAEAVKAGYKKARE